MTTFLFLCDLEKCRQSFVPSQLCCSENTCTRRKSPTRGLSLADQTVRPRTRLLRSIKEVKREGIWTSISRLDQLVCLTCYAAIYLHTALPSIHRTGVFSRPSSFFTDRWDWLKQNSDCAYNLVCPTPRVYLRLTIGACFWVYAAGHPVELLHEVADKQLWTKLHPKEVQVCYLCLC